jgi:hypothetical protein
VSWFPESRPALGPSKAAYRKQVSMLRQELLDAQARLESPGEGHAGTSTGPGSLSVVSG